MDDLICEFVVQFLNDVYNFVWDFIVFEDFLNLVVYIVKCFLEVNEIQVQGCLLFNGLFNEYDDF